MAKSLRKVKVNFDTVETKFDEFLTSRRVNGCVEKTVSTYKNLMHSIGIDMKQNVDEVDWQAIILEIRNRDISDSTRNTYLRTIKIFMKWLGITEGLPKLTKCESIKDLYTDDELKKLIKKPEKNCSFSEFRSWCIVLLVLDTGMRSSSVRNILIKDFNFDNNTVYLRHTKTHKAQILPFSSITKNAIRSLLNVMDGFLDLTPDDFVFITVYGNQLAENGLSRSIEVYNRRRGVSKTSIHLLRHNFARAWITGGNDAFTLQKMLGHSDLTMTQHYCQIYSTDLIDAYKSPVEALERKQIVMNKKNRQFQAALSLHLLKASYATFSI